MPGTPAEGDGGPLWPCCRAVRKLPPGVLLASEEWAALRGLPVQAYLTAGRSAAVDFVNDEGLLMAPTVAVSELLHRTGQSLQDFDYYEIHEAPFIA